MLNKIVCLSVSDSLLLELRPYQMHQKKT